MLDNQKINSANIPQVGIKKIFLPNLVNSFWYLK